MTDRIEISKMDALTFFLRFQIKQVKDGTFISQTKYTRDVLKKIGMDNAKLIKTPMRNNVILILIWAAHQLI
jgi:protein-disulfide isomerase-like protein with CxxC motif